MRNQRVKNVFRIDDPWEFRSRLRLIPGNSPLRQCTTYDELSLSQLELENNQFPLNGLRQVEQADNCPTLDEGNHILNLANDTIDSVGNHKAFHSLSSEIATKKVVQKDNKLPKNFFIAFYACLILLARINILEQMESTESKSFSDYARNVWKGLLITFKRLAMIVISGAIFYFVLPKRKTINPNKISNL